MAAEFAVCECEHSEHDTPGDHVAPTADWKDHAPQAPIGPYTPYKITASDGRTLCWTCSQHHLGGK